VAVAVGILVVAAVAVFVTHLRHAPAVSTHTSHVTGSSASTAGSLGTTPSGAPACPLTGTPAPGGAVPQRPALAVKVDNYPTARPQTGITKADIVFEEPVEGGITRYVAVFQCQTTGMVGPVRSARNIDIGILGQLGHPLLVHVGGINPVIANIQASPLVDIELGDYTSIIQHVTGRYAPYDTYTSTTAVWKLRPTDTTPPQPLFSYSTKPPAGTPVHTVSIPFSVYSEVDWRYDAAAHRFLRYFGTTPDVLSDGVQNSATNVIVQFVDVTYGPWLENTEGGLEVQANLYTHASGQALVFRNGVEVKGEWSRSALGQPTSFTTTNGAPISLAPGTTWVELVPSTIGVTTTPPAGG
jgi:hypothetical protein